MDFMNKGTIRAKNYIFYFFKWLMAKTEKLKLKLIQQTHTTFKHLKIISLEELIIQ